MKLTNLNKFDPSNMRHVELLQKNIKIIKNTIKKLNLDLSNLTILTEAATGHWIYTPFIAYFAGASKVFCITKDTKFGTSKEIKSNFDTITKYLKINDIVVSDKLTKNLIHKSDIITNSGMLRPINKKFIHLMKPTAVIPLMWEPWELLRNDIDIKTCIKNQICVLGVNEQNNILNAMKYAGKLIVKILKKNNINIKNKKLILVANNDSVLYMIKPLKKLGANVFVVSENFENDYFKNNVQLIGKNLKEKKVEKFLKNSQLIIIDSFPKRQKIIGGKNGLDLKKLKKLSSDVKILVYFGSIDYQTIHQAQLSCYPSYQVKFGHMPWTADYIGPSILIETNSLGLKVGEILSRKRLSGLSFSQSMKDSIDTQFCLDFSKEQKIKFHIPEYY